MNEWEVSKQIMTEHTDSKTISKMLILLEKLGISAKNCRMAEEYLNGEAEDGVLDQLARKDLSAVQRQISDEAKELFDQIRKAKSSRKKEVFVRFFNVVYAIGHDTCHRLFWYNAMERGEAYELYKRMVVYIAIHLESPGCLFHDDYDNLLRMVQGQPENLLEVLPALREEGGLYATAALAMYFCIKYEMPGEVPAEDAALMEEYEESILESLDEWLAEQGCAAHDGVIAQIRKKRRAGAVTGRIEMSDMDERKRRRFRFIISLAYLNFQLSDVLLAVVQTAAAINAEVMLHSLFDVYIGCKGSRTDASVMGVDYDGLFSIDPAVYICFAAWGHYDQVLVRQLGKNRESFLKIMEQEECRRLVHTYNDSCGYDTAPDRVSDSVEWVLDELKQVLQKADSTLYEQLIKSVEPDYEPVIRKLVADTPHAGLAQAYLRGRCKFAELVPYEEEYCDGFATVYYTLKPVMQSFRRHCEDPDFINRCHAFAVLGKFERINYDLEEGALSKKDGLSQFFAGLDSEQVGLAYQLQAFVLLYREVPKSARNYDAVIEKYIDDVEPVFSRFLNENEEETQKAFAQADPEGRCLGLHILGKEPQKYRKEILGYAKDSSRLVLGELRRILCRQRDWEDDIRALLNGKKASVRELAIRVFLNWQEEGSDYNVLFQQVLATEKSAKLVTLLQKELELQQKTQS